MMYVGNVVILEVLSYGNNFDWDFLVVGVQDSLNYMIFWFNNGDNLLMLDEVIEIGMQGFVGVFISFVDLGIVVGIMIYGYLIMGFDVIGNVSNLVDWWNVIYYLMGIMDQIGGGIDLLLFNGWIVWLVLEFLMYGVLFFGGCVGVWFFCWCVQVVKVMCVQCRVVLQKLVFCLLFSG